MRRRRWSRRCRLETSGPWRELGATKLLDISLQPWPEAGQGGTLAAWAVATNGEVVVRQGVTRDCPDGTAWTHVASDILFQVSYLLPVCFVGGVSGGRLRPQPLFY